MYYLRVINHQDHGNGPCDGFKPETKSLYIRFSWENSHLSNQVKTCEKV